VECRLVVDVDSCVVRRRSVDARCVMRTDSDLISAEVALNPPKLCFEACRALIGGRGKALTWD
jgi:hypothetical protein